MMKMMATCIKKFGKATVWNGRPEVNREEKMPFQKSMLCLLWHYNTMLQLQSGTAVSLCLLKIIAMNQAGLTFKHKGGQVEQPRHSLRPDW